MKLLSLYKSSYRYKFVQSICINFQNINEFYNFILSPGHFEILMMWNIKYYNSDIIETPASIATQHRIIVVGYELASILIILSRI